MNITISSKNNEKVFEDFNVINIGTAPNCNYKLDLPFEILISLQKMDDGKWQIINTSKSDKILFRGQPIGGSIQIGSLCKLMIDGQDEFISIKITEAGMNPKTVPGSLELANRKNAEKIKKVQNKKSMSTIGDEDLNEEDIEVLYGKGVGAQTKIKIDRKKQDIERRRAIMTKEIAYKANELRNKIAQNEIIYGLLNLFIIIIPIAMAFIIKDVVLLDNGLLPTKILIVIALALILTTALLKQAQFLILQTNGKRNVNPSTIRIKNMCTIASIGTFVIIITFAIAELVTHRFEMPAILPNMILLTTFVCIFLAVFAGFTENIIAESGEELDSYESREDFQAVVKDYQQWVNLFVNNITKKKLKDINNKIFNLQIKCWGEYLLGVVTAPFLAYGVSQTLAECFPEAAGFIRLAEGFKFSPIFLTLATLMIVFAFHCFSVAFSTSKRVYASNVIKQDGFSDYNVHGVMIHGVESTKNLKKESKKFFLIACGVVLIEVTMNMAYFVGVMGGNIQGTVLSFLCALIPTALLIMETNVVANTKYEIKIREELMEKVDKDY